MYSLNLTLTESEKKRIMSLHNSKKNNYGTSINEQEMSPPTTTKKYKLPGITDENLNSFIQSDNNQFKSANLLTPQGFELMLKPGTAGPVMDFIQMILKLAAYNFTTAADIKKPNYDKTIVDLYNQQTSKRLNNFPFNNFMESYFGSIEMFKKGMETLIVNKLNSLGKS